jgi:hypothetical protein
MLIKLASVRETSSLEQAVIQAQDAGRKYIYVASRVLGAKPDRTGLRQAVGSSASPIDPRCLRTPPNGLVGDHDNTFRQ